MTEEAHALMLIAGRNSPDRDKALKRFYDRWHDDHLVIDIWFAAQALSPTRPALAKIKALTRTSAIQPDRTQQSARADRQLRHAEPGAVQSPRRRRL